MSRHGLIGSVREPLAAVLVVLLGACRAGTFAEGPSSPSPRLVSRSAEPATAGKAPDAAGLDAPDSREPSDLYDRSNPAFPRLQRADEALGHLPTDRTGRVDWVVALDEADIAPRADVHGGGRMRLRDDDIIMSDTRAMPWVRFPHREHTEWLDCSNCHEGIFESVRGANEIDMNGIFEGRHCGVCHDRVAFSVFACERCHSVTHGDSPEAWWVR